MQRAGTSHASGCANVHKIANLEKVQHIRQHVVWYIQLKNKVLMFSECGKSSNLVSVTVLLHHVWAKLWKSCLLVVAVFQSISLYFHMTDTPICSTLFLTPNNLRAPFIAEGSSCRRRWSLYCLCSFRRRLRVFHVWTGMYDRAEAQQISAPGATDGWAACDLSSFLTLGNARHCLCIGLSVSLFFNEQR